VRASRRRGAARSAELNSSSNIFDPQAMLASGV
jgi:hypothetical protein